MTEEQRQAIAKLNAMVQTQLAMVAETMENLASGMSALRHEVPVPMRTFDEAVEHALARIGKVAREEARKVRAVAMQGFES